MEGAPGAWVWVGRGCAFVACDLLQCPRDVRCCSDHVLVLGVEVRVLRKQVGGGHVHRKGGESQAEHRALVSLPHACGREPRGPQ